MNTLHTLALSLLTLAACAGCGRLTNGLWRGKSDAPIERLLVDTALGAGVLSLVFFVLGMLRMYRLPVLSGGSWGIYACSGCFGCMQPKPVPRGPPPFRASPFPVSTFHSLGIDLSCFICKHQMPVSRKPPLSPAFRSLGAALHRPCVSHAHPRARPSRDVRLGLVGLSPGGPEAVYPARGHISYRDYVAFELPDVDGDAVFARGRVEPARGRANARLDVRDNAGGIALAHYPPILRAGCGQNRRAWNRRHADCAVSRDHGVYRSRDGFIRRYRRLPAAQSPEDGRAGISHRMRGCLRVRRIDQDDRPRDNPIDTPLAAIGPRDHGSQVRVEAGADVRGHRACHLRAVVCQIVHLHGQPGVPLLPRASRRQGMDGGDGCFLLAVAGGIWDGARPAGVLDAAVEPCDAFGEFLRHAGAIRGADIFDRGPDIVTGEV